MYTTIKARVNDQTLQLVNLPTLASGGVNENRVEVTFCNLWDGHTKTAVFFRNAAKVYHVLMNGDACMVPHEVTAEEGAFFFGVFGINGVETRTTEVQQLNVEQGAITLATAETDLTPDIYQQLLSSYARIEARLDALGTGQGDGIMSSVTLSPEVFDPVNKAAELKLSRDGIHCYVVLTGVNVTIPQGNFIKYTMPEPYYYAPCTELMADSYIIMGKHDLGVYFYVSGSSLYCMNISAGPVTLTNEGCSGFFPLKSPTLPELADMRVGPDGTTYESAGEHLRAIEQSALGAYWATYGETTLDEILAAYRAGKAVFAKKADSSLVLPLHIAGSPASSFSGVSASAVQVWSVTRNGWTETTKDLAEKNAAEFIAEYGVTTFAEIYAAFADGQEVYCKHGAYKFPLIGYSAPQNKAFFGASSGDYYRSITVSGSTWAEAYGAGAKIETSDEHIYALIDERLGVIENGTY